MSDVGSILIVGFLGLFVLAYMSMIFSPFLVLTWRFLGYYTFLLSLLYIYIDGINCSEPGSGGPGQRCKDVPECKDKCNKVYLLYILKAVWIYMFYKRIQDPSITNINKMTGGVLTLAFFNLTGIVGNTPLPYWYSIF